MEIEFNPNGKYLALAALVLIIGVGAVSAQTASQVSHTWSEIGVGEAGYCVFSVSQTGCPGGWSRVSTPINRLLMVNWSAGGTGGTNAHTHIFSFSTGQGSNQEKCDSGSSHVALKQHSHSAYGTSGSATMQMPDHAKLLICCRN
jgi:hypothetical protein